MRGVVLALLLAVAFPASADARSFALREYYEARGDFYASELIRVAPVTGATIPVRGVRLGDAAREHVLSPDHRVVAFGGLNFGEVVFVDVARMRKLPSLKVGGQTVDVLAWPSADRMIVLTSEAEGKHTTPKTLRVVDPIARKVLASRPLGFVLATSTSAAGQVVLVASPAKDINQDSIAPAHLVSASPDGAIRELVLPHVTAGLAPGAIRIPGLAVDYATQRAWVIGGGEPVADVDLTTGAVTDRPALAAATAPQGPPRETGTQNPVDGPARTAQWLGDGRIAVSGYDATIVGYDQAHTPTGLRILDTRGWMERVIEPKAEMFTMADDTLLTFRNGYGSDGTRRFRLPTSDWLVRQDRLYVLRDRRRAQLRDHATGATLRNFPRSVNLFTLFSI